MRDSSHDHPPAGQTFFAVIAATLITVALVYALRGYFGQVLQAQEEEKVIEVRYDELQRHRKEAEDRLGGYGWSDERKTMIHQPVYIAAEGYLRDNGVELEPRD
jgi:hypothetical protein